MRKTNNYKSKNYRKKLNKTIKKTHNKSVKKTMGGDKKRKNKSVIDSKTVVGKIYADWCGYCQMMQNDWDNLKRDLGENKKIEFVDIEQKNEGDMVNNVNEKHLKKSLTKVGLQGGYPTIFKIKNGKLSYFNGNRIFEDMKKWCLE